MTIKIYIILFFIYAFIGWILEVVSTFWSKKKLINRGFLIGPICPIYGFGTLAIILMLNRFVDEPLVLFIMSIVICSFLEYLTSYIMEKIFKARWWDYSDKKFNINGRICLNTMIPFGLLGTFVVCFINPTLIRFISKFDVRFLTTSMLCLLTIFIIDLFVSFRIIYGFNNTLKRIKKDNTEEITSRIRKILLENNAFYKRLIKAFPKLKAFNNLKK